MANIGTSLKNWSTTASSNQPDGTDAATIAGDMRDIQAAIRLAIASQDTIASAATTDLGSKDAGSLTISGTTTITSLGTVSAGITKRCVFSGALTLTHNATSLILPGAANITTVAGDVLFFESLGSGNWRCVLYLPTTGSPVTTSNTVTMTNKTLTSPTISGGTINNAVIGGSTPAAGTFTTLAANGNTTLGDAGADTVTINASTVSIPNNLNFDSNTLFLDASNNRVGVGTASPSVPLQVDASSATYGINQRWRHGTFGNSVLGASSGKFHFVTDANNLSFHTASNLGTDGSATPSNEWARITSTGDFQSLGSIGYATGTGGAVAQATSKSTGVTLNTINGQITLNGAALAANTIVSFTLTNSKVASTDLCVLNHQSVGTLGAYGLNASCGSGNVVISVRNNTGGSLSEAIVLSFAIIKGVTS